MPLGDGQYRVHPCAGGLFRGRRQVVRPKSGVHHKRCTRLFGLAVRVADKHAQNILRITVNMIKNDFLIPSEARNSFLTFFTAKWLMYKIY